MGLGDSLSDAISNIYEAIQHYEYSYKHKQELINMLTSMEHTLLKIDNTDKEVGDHEMDLLKEIVAKRFELARNGGDPWSVRASIVLKDKPCFFLD